MGMERHSPDRVIVHIVIKVLREFGEYNSPISTDQFLKNKLFKEHKLHVMTRLADYISVLVNLERNTNSNTGSREEKSNTNHISKPSRSMSILANTGTSKLKIASASQKQRVAQTRNKEYDTFLNKDKLALGRRNSSSSPTSSPRQFQSPKSLRDENEGIVKSPSASNLATPAQRSSMSESIPPPPPPSSRRKSETDVFSGNNAEESNSSSTAPPPPIGMSPRQRRDSATKYVAFDQQQSDASNILDNVAMEEEKVDTIDKAKQTIPVVPIAKKEVSTDTSSENVNSILREPVTTVPVPAPATATATAEEFDNRSLMALLMALGKRVRQLEGLSVVSNSKKQSGVYKDNVTPRKRITRTFARNLNQLPITMDGSPRTPFREMNTSMNLDVDINNKEILSMHDLNEALSPEYPSYANTSVQEEQVLHNMSIHSLSGSNNNIFPEKLSAVKMGSVKSAYISNFNNDNKNDGIINNMGLVDTNGSPLAQNSSSNAFTTGANTSIEGSMETPTHSKYPGSDSYTNNTNTDTNPNNSNGSGSEYIDALFLLLERRMFHKLQDELMKQMEQRIQRSEHKHNMALQNTFSELDDVVTDLSSRIETLEMLYKEAAADRKQEQQELESFMSQTKYSSSSMRDIGNAFRR